jgi:hypothetical protein
MRIQHRTARLLLPAVALLALSAGQTAAQTPDQAVPRSADQAPLTYFFPAPAGPKNIMQTVGLSLAKLPEDVVETDDVFRAPLFAYNIKYGLPENLNLEAGLSTNIITYHFTLGPSWNYGAGRWGFSVGSDLAYWFGQLKQFGFNTTYNGWVLYPNISAGYAFDAFSISAKAEAVLDLAETSKNGENEISDNHDFFNGYTIGIYLEQPLWKANYVVVGARATYLKFYYPMWAAFSTFDRAYYIPEFTFKFIL